MKLSRLSPPYCFGFFRDQSPRNLLFRFFRYQTPYNPIASSLKRTAMHYRAISYINLPKTYDEAILAQFVVHHATDSNRTIRVECLRCHHTCQIFKCRFAVGQLPADSWPTVYRQTFRGAVLHFYQKYRSNYRIQGHSGPAYANWVESFVERGR